VTQETQTATNGNEQSQSLRDQLINEHYHLVASVARNVRRSLSVHIELDDLTHAGNLGLVDAASKYDDSNGVPFPMYAKHRIRGAILDSLRQLDWASREARKQYRQMEVVTRDLAAKLQRNPTSAEVAEAMGIDEERWRALMIDFGTLGLAENRKAFREDEDGPVREQPAPVSQSPENLFANAQLKSRIAGVLEQLPGRHQQVVKLYYEKDMSMRDIGSVLGVNESRVSQIHKAALLKMRTTLSAAGVSLRQAA
jgi:RNA polymerase sigma factor FliA